MANAANATTGQTVSDACSPRFPPDMITISLPDPCDS